MSKEELLKVRYKVIADWPGSIWLGYNTGDIITMNDDLTFLVSSHVGNRAFPLDFDAYPHLFKRLEWWQSRKFTELPEYIKWSVSPDENLYFFKVDNWYSDPNTSEWAGVYVENGHRLFIKDCTPATESEYLDHLKQKKL